MSFTHAAIHYDEIGLKGKNRHLFEKRLIQNIKKKLGDLQRNVHRETGQITVLLREKAGLSEVREALKQIPGIAHFCFAMRTERSVGAMKKTAEKMLKGKKFSSFRIFARRYDKNYEHTSLEVNRELGKYVVDTFAKKVDLEAPDLTIKVEISNAFAYLSLENIKGVGGMPTNKKKRVACLLSGGFDSAVAAYLMMKRGCTVDFVHFWNKNQMSGAVQEKVLQLTKHLAQYQLETKLFVVPFADIQEEIIMQVPSDLRMLVYRRFMLRIASMIAEKEHAKFLVTGDSMAQVASQTLENLEAVYKVSPMPILTPVIGFDKREIIALARDIGTYVISKQPYPDCCSFLIAKHPSTKTTPEVLQRQEEMIAVGRLAREAVERAKIEEVA